MTNKNDILLIEPFEQGKTNLAEEKPKIQMPTRRSRRRRRSTSGSGSKSGTMPNRKSKGTGEAPGVISSRFPYQN